MGNGLFNGKFDNILNSFFLSPYSDTMLSQFTYNAIEMNIRRVSYRVMNGLDSGIIKRYWREQNCGRKIAY
jgi:hypothetical protein